MGTLKHWRSSFNHDTSCYWDNVIKTFHSHLQLMNSKSDSLHTKCRSHPNLWFIFRLRVLDAYLLVLKVTASLICQATQPPKLAWRHTSQGSSQQTARSQRQSDCKTPKDTCQPGSKQSVGLPSPCTRTTSPPQGLIHFENSAYGCQMQNPLQPLLIYTKHAEIK